MGAKIIITAKMNRDFGACYSDDRLAELYGEGKTPHEVATLKTGPWADVISHDRCWILWRLIAVENKPGMREALSRMLERVLPKNCDPRSGAVVKALRENKVTRETEDAAAAARADAAAYAADAAADADAAAYAADAAAYAADAAAYAADAAAYAAYAADAAAYAADADAADAAAYAADAADAADAAADADADAYAARQVQIDHLRELLS